MSEAIDMAAFIAPLFLMPGKDSAREVQVEQAAQPGRPVLVTSQPAGTVRATS